MVMRAAVSVFAFLAVLAAGQSAARACSCEARTPAQYVAGADRVLLARVGGESETKHGFETSFDVLHTFKGKAVASFTWKRKHANPLCGPSYSDGDVAILFVSSGDLHLCSGNSTLADQLKDLPAYIAATSAKTSSVSLAAMKAALTSGLKGYLHNRPKIWAHHAPLKGKSLQIGRSHIRFRASTKKTRASKSAIDVERAVSVGSLVYVSGHYPIEGLTFRVLLGNAGKGFEVVVMEISEQ